VSQRVRVIIESLPDNVLLDIFDFYRVINKYEDEHEWDWETLVHVCQRWRYVVFESPIRLNLQLFCTGKTPVRKLLHIWPASLPITIHFHCDELWVELDNPVNGFGNILAALKHCDRVRQIHVTNAGNYQWDKIVNAMQGPFPALRSLSFDSGLWTFALFGALIGPAPCLQHLNLRTISFPLLPRLLLSTSDLISLRLLNIPDSGYISPVTMATSLSALPKLETLFIDFEYPTRHPERPSPPSTRFVLPALADLQFQGMSEYFEVLVAQIDAPLLDRFNITFGFSRQPELVFDIPQTVRVFSHLKWPKPSSLALMFHPARDTSIISPPSDTMPHSMCPRSWKIMGRYLDWQVSSVAHICSQILPFCASVESLIIQCPGFGSHSDLLEWILRGEMDSTLWPRLFRSFTSVHNLEISAPLEPFIAAAFQGLTEESAAEVFPSLHSFSIVGKTSDNAVQQGIQSFVAARQHSSHPVTISCREVN
jgi:F-box-like